MSCLVYHKILLFVYCSIQLTLNLCIRNLKFNCKNLVPGTAEI